MSTFKVGDLVFNYGVESFTYQIVEIIHQDDYKITCSLRLVDTVIELFKVDIGCIYPAMTTNLTSLTLKGHNPVVRKCHKLTKIFQD